MTEVHAPGPDWALMDKIMIIIVILLHHFLYNHDTFMCSLRKVPKILKTPLFFSGCATNSFCQQRWGDDVVSGHKCTCSCSALVFPANNQCSKCYFDHFTKHKDLLTFKVEAVAATSEQILFMSTEEVKKLSEHTPAQLWSLSVSKNNRPFVTSAKEVAAGGSVSLFVSKIT